MNLKHLFEVYGLEKITVKYHRSHSGSPYLEVNVDLSCYEDKLVIKRVLNEIYFGEDIDDNFIIESGTIEISKKRNLLSFKKNGKKLVKVEKFIDREVVLSEEELDFISKNVEHISGSIANDFHENIFLDYKRDLILDGDLVKSICRKISTEVTAIKKKLEKNCMLINMYVDGHYLKNNILVVRCWYSYKEECRT